MTTLQQAAQQALKCIERLNAHGWILADYEDEVYAAITALREALAQPTQWPISAHAAMRDASLNVGWGSEQGDKHD